MDTLILRAINTLSNARLKQAVVEFLAEQKLTGEFLVWIERWKINNGVVGYRIKD